MSEGTALRIPRFGDAIMVEDGRGIQQFCGGVVNNQEPLTIESTMLVGTNGHFKSNAVAVRVDAYLTDWHWPEDVIVEPRYRKEQQKMIAHNARHP